MTPRVAKPLSVSPKELLILNLLIGGGEQYGLQLVAASKRRLKRGTVYVTLGRMEDKGLITSRLDAPPVGLGGLPRPLYDATSLGRRVARAWASGEVILLPEAAR
jgi:PadR family transcriptional regulator PadR